MGIIVSQLHFEHGYKVLYNRQAAKEVIQSYS